MEEIADGYSAVISDLLSGYEALVSAEGMLMTPRRTDTDGFFVSILRRSS